MSSPMYPTSGILDVASSTDPHHMVVQKVGLHALEATSTRTFDSKTKLNVRFMLPVIQWVFESEAKVSSCNKEDTRLEEGYVVALSLTSMSQEDKKKLEEFVDLLKNDQIVIEDIL